MLIQVALYISIKVNKKQFVNAKNYATYYICVNKLQIKQMAKEKRDMMKRSLK